MKLRIMVVIELLHNLYFVNMKQVLKVIKKSHININNIDGYFVNEGGKSKLKSLMIIEIF